MDDLELLPQNADEAFWWEVWLPERGNRELVVEDFRKLASAVGCTVSTGHVDFPERTVVMMHGSERQFSQTVMTLNCCSRICAAPRKRLSYLTRWIPRNSRHEGRIVGTDDLSGSRWRCASRLPAR